MRKQLLIALLCMAVSTPAFSEVYDVAANQKLSNPFKAAREREAERLRQEQMRLQNVLLSQENEQRRQEAKLELERLRLQIEALERERTQEAANIEQGETGPDIFEQLQKLGQLRDDGVLTEEEFDELKKKILDDFRSSNEPDSIIDSEVLGDATSSNASNLIATTHTPGPVSPIIIQQIDGKKISQAQSSLTTALESHKVEPGVHQIIIAPKANPENGQLVTIDVKPGVDYYLGWHDSEPAIWKEKSN